MDLFEMIKWLPLFRHFSTEEKRRFVELDHNLVEFKQGDLLIKEGETDTSLYILLQGSVIIKKTGYRVPISKLTAGSVFGEMSFLSKRPRHTNVIANESGLALMMDQAFFNTIEAELREKIKSHLIELLVIRLDAMNDSLVRLSKTIRKAKGSAA
jgi:serine/threonine-protein kinase